MKYKQKYEDLYTYIAEKFGKDFLKMIWSNKNILNPKDINAKSGKVAWWKCPNGLHEDFERK